MYLKHERSTSQHDKMQEYKKKFSCETTFQHSKKGHRQKKKNHAISLEITQPKKKIHINKVSKRINKNKNNFPFLSPNNPNKKKQFSIPFLIIKKTIFH